MAKVKRKMTKDDAQAEISSYVIKNYPQLKVTGKDKPDTVERVLATIQNSEFIGAGTYSVLLELSGTIYRENGDRLENVRYTTICNIIVTSNDIGEPIPQIDETLYLTKCSH